MLYKLNKSFLRTFGRAFRNVPAAGRNVNGKAAVIVWGAAGAGHASAYRTAAGLRLSDKKAIFVGNTME